MADCSSSSETFRNRFIEIAQLKFQVSNDKGIASERKTCLISFETFKIERSPIDRHNFIDGYVTT
ncbi:MAG: hypothetical protein ACTS5R_00020 [Candidatus Hodgkinia cicadicola]